MKKKIFSITVVMILILLGVTTVSDARMSMSKQYSKIEKTTTQNRVIPLGSATVYGDGIEENTIVEVSIELNEVKIEPPEEYVDLQMSYSLQCDADKDIGIVILLAQVNFESRGDNVVLADEIESGDIVITDVLLKNLNVLTVEAAAFYINSDPVFYRFDIGTGGAIVEKKSRNIHTRLHRFPLVQSLLGLLKFNKLIT